MRILLLHSEDDLEHGPWAGRRWDRVIDLGLGGVSLYKRWQEQAGCPVSSLGSLQEGVSDLWRVRESLGEGCGRLIDEFGLDWWEIMSILVAEETRTLLLLQRFAGTVNSEDEVHLSRPGLHAALLKSIRPDRVSVFRTQRAVPSHLRRYLRACNRLSFPQMIDVFWDKYDSGQQLRSRWTKKRSPSARPVVLIPTAYVNVSLTGVAYANSMPDQEFLLISTRRSGWIENPPPNMQTVRLSAYVSMRDRRAEFAEIERLWCALLRDSAHAPAIETLHRLGYLNNFPRWIRNGIEVRDAWRNVFDREPIQGVLCSDDSNPYTRMPLLLAKERGLPNVACHHGALDGRYAFKRAYGDTIWAKGEMERDYLVSKCRVPAEKVEICAPRHLLGTVAEVTSTSQSEKPYIIFFSEPYEVFGGRVEGFYRDILMPLSELASASGRRLLVKLHPAESKSERARFVRNVLSATQRNAVEVISGPLTADLLGKAWFGITVISTVATECALRGVPCYLCKWLEGIPYEYAEQFLKFGAAIGLNHPGEIANIPFLLNAPPRSAPAENFWQAGSEEDLRKLIASRAEYAAKAS